MTEAQQTIAHLDAAGINAYDVFLRNRHIGIIANAGTNKVRCYFNMTATKGSTRRFASDQDAVGYLVERRERRLAKARGQ